MSATTASVTSTPLLKFALVPIPDPPQAGKQLTLRFVANKPRQTSQVFCDSITFRFDVDASPCTRPSCLATDSGQQTVTPLEWDSLDPHDPGAFTFVPSGGDEVTKSYTFDIFEIDVSTIVGTATVTVTEHSTDHDAAHCPNDDHDACYQNRTVSFDVPKFPAGFGGVDFTPDKTAVPPGGDVTLSWQVEKVASYQLLEGDDPIDPGKMTHTTIGDVTTWSYKAEGLEDNTVFTLRVGYEEAEEKIKREYYVPVDVQRPSLTLLVQGGRTSIRAHEWVTFKWDIAHVTGCSLYAKAAGGPPHLVKSIDGLKTCDAAPAYTTTYYLGGKTEAGDGITSNQVEVDIVPAAPPMSADLVFIKTAVTGDAVELHIDGGAGGYQQRSLDLTTGLAARQGPSGTWILKQESNGSRVLLFVKTRETDAGRVEVHWDPPSTFDYQNPVSSIYTPFTEAEAADGTWQIPVMDHNSGPDLFFIKTARTRSGSVELFMQNSTEALGYNRWITPFPASDEPNGTWLLGDIMLKHTWPPDLAFIQTSGTASGQVELSYALRAYSYQRIDGGPFVTGFDCAGAGDGTWQLVDMTGDGRLDLAFVKTANTQSGRVEVHYAAATDSYQSLQGGYTEFDVAEGPNGTWQLL